MGKNLKERSRARHLLGHRHDEHILQNRGRNNNKNKNVQGVIVQR